MLKINSKAFQVLPGEKIDLQKRATLSSPVYKSIAEYQDILKQHISELSTQQQLLYASNQHAVLLIFKRWMQQVKMVLLNM